MPAANTGTYLLIAAVWLLIGMAAVHRKLQTLHMLHMVSWRDAFAVLVLVVFWPVLVVF